MGLDSCVTERTELVSLNFLFVGSMLADWTKPELIVHQGLPSHNASGEFRVAAGTYLTIIWDQSLATSTFRFVHSVVLGTVPVLENHSLH